MTFILYQNKSSLDNKNCRLVQGGSTDTIGTFLGWWEKRKIAHDDVTDLQFVITADYAFRPDKISYKLYGRDDYDWIILQYNNIIDINEEMTIGTVLTVPSYDRAMYNLTNNR